LKVPYEPGELQVKAYNAAGECIGTNALHTAKDKISLHLEPENDQVAPGRLLFVPICYTDEDGILAPMAKHRVEVEVTGGRLLGLGNACSYNPDGYTSHQVKTYYGRAMAVIQADENSETVCIRAKDETEEVTAQVPVR
jgi:beta-galactosidase